MYKVNNFKNNNEKAQIISGNDAAVQVFSYPHTQSA